MKFWGYFVAKLAAAAGFLWGVWRLMYAILPEPDVFLYTRISRFPQDLPWTTAILLFWLLSIGILYVIIWDQRRRCRVCLRLLRMPVVSGSWSMATLFSPPRVSSICPYGHGTLEVPEAHVTGQNPTEWHPHGDIWTELEELDKPRK